MPTVKLTAKFVETLALAKAGQQDVWDASRPGFGLRIGAKRKSWQMTYRHDGKQKRLTLGHYPGMSLAKARIAADAAQDKLDHGIDPAAEKKQQAEAAADARRNTVGVVVDEFLRRYVKPRHKRPENTERIFNRYILPRWRERPIGSITRRELIELLDEIADGGAPVAANRTLASVRKLYNWATARDIVTSSPCARVQAPSAEISRERILTADEIRSLWNATERMGYPFGPLFRMLLVAGQRREEVNGMCWSEISADGTVWTIPAERSKNGRAHPVPLSDMARAALADMPRFEYEDGRQSDYVFTTQGGRPVSGFSKAKRRCDDLILKALRKAAKENGADPDSVKPLPAWRLHDIRRTVASNMARLGVNRLVISKVLNHTEAGVTSIYDRHSYDAEKRHALDTWSRYLNDLTGGSPGNVVALASRIS